MSTDNRTLVAHRAGTTETELRTTAATPCDMLEVDVHQTGDDEIILASNPYYQHGEYHTAWPDVTLGETAAKDVVTKNEHIPLREALNVALDTGTGLMIDVKRGPHYYKGIENTLLETLQSVTLPSDVVIMSFDHPWIQSLTESLQSMNLDIPTGLIYVAHLHNPEETIRDTGVDIIETQNRFITERLDKTLTETETQLSGWATESRDRLREQVILGVDYYKTDDVPLAIEIAKEMKND